MINDLVISQIRQRLEILYQMVDELETGGGGGGGGTTNYNDLSNKPAIEGQQLVGNKTASDLGLATTSQLNGKVDKVEGSSLMTSAQATKLEGIEAGAEVNVQADWNQANSSADDYIKNKPTLGAAAEKGVDTVPTDDSTNLITSGAVYDAIQGAGGGIEYVECPIESGYYMFPADKMSVLSVGSVFSFRTAGNYLGCVTYEDSSEYIVVKYGLIGNTIFGGRISVNKTTRRVLEYGDSFITEGTVRAASPIRLYSTNDIDTLYAFNNKYWGSTEYNPPSNIPNGVSGQFLLVNEKFEDGSTTLQRLYTENGEVYQRVGSGSGWNPWYKFTGTIVT